MTATQELERAGKTPIMVCPGKLSHNSLSGVDINVRECEEEIKRLFAPFALPERVHEAGSLCMELRGVASHTPAKIPQATSEPVPCSDLLLTGRIRAEHVPFL